MTHNYLTFKPSQQIAEAGIARVESCICDIRRWMRDNFLKLNDDKTEFMIIGSPQQLTKISIPFIKIGDHNICPVSQARNLGVIFDSHMSFKSHISHTVRSAQFHMRNIGKIRKYLTRNSTEQIIHSFVTSRLDMGNSLLFGLPQEQLSRFQRIQNAAARLVTLTKMSTHITPILKDLHWLPISYRIIYKLLLLVYKALNGKAPPYIMDLLSTYQPSRTLRSRNKHLLIEPRSHRSWGDRSFSVAAPHLWNQLPLHIRSSDSILSFKKSLKTHLMSQAFT